jgi:hypothetical protein
MHADPNPEEAALREGACVRVTGKLQRYMNECLDAGLSWPDDTEGKPRARAVKKQAQILQMDVGNRMVRLSDGIDWVPIRALHGFSTWTPEAQVADICWRHELDLLLLQDDDIILAQVDAARARLWADKAAPEGAEHGPPEQEKEELQEEQGSTRSCTSAGASSSCSRSSVPSSKDSSTGTSSSDSGSGGAKVKKAKSWNLHRPGQRVLRGLARSLLPASRPRAGAGSA